MARPSKRWLDRMQHSRSLDRWRLRARAATSTDLADLKAQRAQARQMQAAIGELLHVADSRLALPRIGSATFNKPPGTLWSWRPQVWRGPIQPQGVAAAPSKTPIGDEIVLFHDCARSELTLRQVRNTRESDLAPFGLRMDVFAFDGSFLSLVLDLPQEAFEDLRRKHVLRLGAIVEAESPLDIFARLNIKHGPNTETMVLEIPVNQPESVVEYDLAYVDLNERRIEKVWLDLIFEGPQMNQITLRDLNFARYPRAEL